jgi:integrase
MIISASCRLPSFDRPEKIRPFIRQWRNQWADKPRTADYGLQVLSAVLSHAVDLGRIAGNPCIGIKRLYGSEASRAEIIWTSADLARLKASCREEITHAVDLAVHSGLRLGDLLRLTWNHIGAEAIEIATGKSGGRRTAVIPLHDELRAALGRIPRRAVTVLTSSTGRAWTRDSFISAFHRAKHDAGMGEANLHFHDLRGTEILGWQENQVGRIIRKYVSRTAAVAAIIQQMRVEPVMPRFRGMSVFPAFFGPGDG